MRVLVDMDGVLADFDAPVWDIIRDENWRIDIPGRDAQVHHYVTEHMPDEWTKRLLRKRIDRHSFFRELPEIPGAVEGLRGLLDAGLDIWICTKPLESNLNCRDDKAHWVRRRWPELEQKLIFAPDKSMVKGDILLDDATKPEWAEIADWNPVMFSQPYNGPGTQWENWPHWTWGDSVEDLILKGLYDKGAYLRRLVSTV